MRDGVKYYYTRDHLGSIRELTDASGNIRAQYNYDPYGLSTQLQGDLDTNIGYTGHYRHDNSGLLFAPFRAYDPTLGRWLNRDPIGEAGGFNLYGYVGNNPVNYTDSSGLIIDTIADAGFILYDLYKLASDGACERNANLTALGLDFIGAITPGITGLGSASRVAKGANNVEAVIAETLAGKGNITSSIKLSADELLQAGEQFLGSGYKEIGESGSGVFRSADNLRQFRIDNGSLLGIHSPGVPHGHLETYAPGASKFTTNNHIPFYN